MQPIVPDAIDSILIVAGEASADLHGAKVLSALRARRPGVEVFGIGGEEMRACGLQTVTPAEDISVAGLTEVLFAIPRILGILNRLTQMAKERRPKVAILLDLPDFNLRLAERLKKLGIPVVYYISPQVWAWRQKRVEQIKRVVDQMLVILPFEEPFYRERGVSAQFVGHPLVEELASAPTREAARQSLGMAAEGPLVALLPGSRKKEVTRHLPLMLAGLALLQKKMPTLRGMIPVASTISRALIESFVKAAGVQATVVDGQATEVLSASDAAVVCSGTATLQTALLLRPMVVVYRVSWLSFQILKRLVKVAHIALVNLIAGRAVVSELVQSAFTAESVSQELERLLQDAGYRADVTQALLGIKRELSQTGASDRVAEVTLTYLPLPKSQQPPSPVAHA